MHESTKIKLIWPIIILTCLPILGIIHPPAAPTLKATALYLSEITGYVGVMFLLWMYILGAKSAMGVVFKDLASVLTIHKALGKWGSLAFLYHPLLITYSYGESILYSVIPNVSTQFESNVTLGRVSFMIIFVIWVTSVFLREKLRFRPWKYIHYLAYISLPFALLHVPNIGSQFIDWPFVRVYYIAIVAVFGIFTLFRLASWLNLDRKTYTIVGHQRLTPEDLVLTLKPNKLPVAPQIGQYVYLKVGYISEDHPFTVTYYDAGTGELTLAYRVYGGFTKYLSRLTKGVKVSIAGPYGTFMKEFQPGRPVVYIAAGIGITPFVQRIVDDQKNPNQWLFVSNRTHASAVLVGNIRQYIGSRCVQIYSREPAGPGEESGHISKEIISRHLASPESYSYYICGSKEFMEESTKILKELAIPAKNIYSEKFSW